MTFTGKKFQWGRFWEKEKIRTQGERPEMVGDTTALDGNTVDEQREENAKINK